MSKTAYGKLTPQESEMLARHYAASFNRDHKPGSTVWFWATPTLGPVYETRVKRLAFAQPNDDRWDSVVFLQGIQGTVPTRLVKPVNEERRSCLNPVDLGNQAVVQAAAGQRNMHLAWEQVKSWHNAFLPGFGSKDCLRLASEYLRIAAENLEAAYQLLGEGQ